MIWHAKCSLRKREGVIKAGSSKAQLMSDGPWSNCVGLMRRRKLYVWNVAALASAFPGEQSRRDKDCSQ
jgi:hypothetical protein